MKPGQKIWDQNNTGGDHHRIQRSDFCSVLKLGHTGLLATLYSI